MRKRGYELLLFITFIAMAAVFVYLNFFTDTQAGDITNIIVNLVMFVLVAIILLSAALGSLLPTARMTADLIRVTDKIEDDARNSHRFLWEKYREEKEELFTSDILLRQYQDYRYELERVAHTDRAYYKCDIEDYIGMDLVDSVIHRERLSQIAGVMTGLGILGTFIGLSLGLQGFNTGSTAEITGSIEPLMGGIKVAFHTSIYGMVFSLVFNYVYRKRLDAAEGAVRDFLSAYRKYVVPDTALDGFNRLIELQKQQTDAILGISDAMANQLSKELRDLLEPQFEHFDHTIESFANIATKNQMSQLNRVVDAFLDEMNRSLGNVFSNLSDKVDSTIALQKANEMQMNELFEKNIGTAENVSNVALQTQHVSDSLRQYAEKVTLLEQEITQTLEMLKQQNESNKALINSVGKYVSGLDYYRESVEHSVNAYDERLKTQEERLATIQQLIENINNTTLGIYYEEQKKV